MDEFHMSMAVVASLQTPDTLHDSLASWTELRHAVLAANATHLLRSRDGVQHAPATVAALADAILDTATRFVDPALHTAVRGADPLPQPVLADEEWDGWAWG
jgi:hypothetical protein